MGKGGLFLTFLGCVVLLVVGWYVLVPDDPVPSDPVGDRLETAVEPEGLPDPEARSSTVTRRVPVTGRVLARKTGKPIAGARVVFAKETDEDDVRPETRDATTDGDGEWASEFGIGPVAERVVASGLVTAEGYLPQRITVHVRPWETAHRSHPIRLFRASARVRGRVLTVDGEPVPGARVHDKPVDAEGRYGPIVIGAGIVTLRAFAPGHPMGTLRFTLDPGPVREIVKDIYLPVSVPLTGLVLDEDGHPLAGASYRVVGGHKQVTDADGRFSIPAVNGEHRAVQVMKDGWLPFSGRAFAGRSLTVRLRRGGVLVGRLLMHDGDPVGTGFRISLRSRVEAADLLDAATGEDGRFRMTLPAGGPVEIEVRRGHGPICGAFVVEMPKGEVLERDFTLLAPQPYPVRVTSAETGEPVPDATIRGGWLEVGEFRTDADGNAEVPGLHPRAGRVKMPFLVEAFGFLPETFHASGGRAPADPPISIALMPRSTIDVTVVDADGQPVPDATVDVRLSEPRRQFQTRTGADGRVGAVAPAGRLVLVGVITPDRGSGTVNATAPAKVTIRLDPPKTAGPRRVRVMASDTEPLIGAWVQGGNGRPIPVGEDGRVEVPGTTDWIYVMAPGRASALLDLEDVAEGEEKVVRLEPGRDLEVTVLDTTGGPLTGAQIHVTSGTNRSVPVPGSETESNGKAILRGLPNDLEVFVVGKLYGFTNARAWVAPGATAAEVRLAPMGEVVIAFGGTGLRAGQPISWRWRTLDRGPLSDEVGAVHSQWVPDNSGRIKVAVPTGRIALLVECAGAAPRIYPELTVTPDRPGEVVYDFPEPGGLRVTVRDEDGNYVDAARLFIPGINWHFAWTTARGKIPTEKRTRIPVGRVRLAVAAKGFATVWTESVDLADDGELEIVLPKGCAIEGVLVDRAGKPVAGRIRVLTHVDQPDRYDEAGDDGRFVLARRLAPGEHRVWVHGRGHAPIVVPIRVTGGPKARAEIPVE